MRQTARAAAAALARVMLPMLPLMPPLSSDAFAPLLLLLALLLLMLLLLLLGGGRRLYWLLDWLRTIQLLLSYDARELPPSRPLEGSKIVMLPVPWL